MVSIATKVAMNRLTKLQVLSRPVNRAGSMAARFTRRGFHSTRPQLGSQYHYPEGPRSNIPFDPLKKGFALKFWGFCGKFLPGDIVLSRLTINLATGYFTPYAIACESCLVSNVIRVI